MFEKPADVLTKSGILTVSADKLHKTDLTDEQWKILGPLLPRQSVRGQPREHSLREILNPIFYLVDGGIKWRSMPHDLPPWQSVYYYFRQWTRVGAGNNSIQPCANRSGGRPVGIPEQSAAVIDSQSVKTTEEAAADTRGYDSGKQIKGRKRHLLVDTMGLVMKVVTLCANIQDRDGAQTLFDQIRATFTRLQKVWADGAYASPNKLGDWVKARMA